VAELKQYILFCHVMDPFTIAAGIAVGVAVNVATPYAKKAVDGIVNYASGFLSSKRGGGGGGGRRVGGKQIQKNPNLNKKIIIANFFTFNSKNIA
jgi:hypothetical protein